VKILIINGPNLNLLGKREPVIYGSLSLSNIENRLQLIAKEKNVAIKMFQSNSESAIIEIIQKSMSDVDGIIINAGAYTHTSIGIRDAFKAVNIPFVEVHISNIFSREEFRKKSYLSDIAIGVITGLGSYGYECSLNFLVDFLS